MMQAAALFLDWKNYVIVALLAASFFFWFDTKSLKSDLADARQTITDKSVQIGGYDAIIADRSAEANRTVVKIQERVRVIKEQIAPTNEFLSNFKGEKNANDCDNVVVILDGTPD